MSFGEVARADVGFHANTGEFNRETAQIRETWKRTTGALSSDTLRAAVAQEKLDRAISRHGPASLQAKNATLSYRREMEQLNRHQSTLGRLLPGHTRDVGSFSRGALAGSGALRGLGRAVGFASTSFLGGAGLAFALKSTLDKAGEFQQTLNVLKSVSGGTAQQMTRVAAVAKQLGNDVTLPATSAADAARAMTELAKAGLSLPQSMAAARGTLQLAAAAQIEEADAATISARALNAFGLSGDKAARVADVLAATANSATGDITDFALGFQQSSAVAHQYGLTLEDTATALAELANAGVVGSDAGTSLKTMLQRLNPQTKKAREEMADLGIRWKDGHGNLLPLRNVIGQYHSALEKLSPAQRQSALYAIFGSDAIRAANIILGDGVGAFDKMHHAVSRHGAASKLAAAQTKGYKGALDAFKSTVETTQITIGTALLPAITRYLRSGAAWLGTTKHQRDIQRDVNRVLHDGAEAAHVIASGFRGFRSVLRAVNFETGGMKHTIELLAIAFAGLKIARFVTEIRTMATAWRGVTTAANTAATAEARAGAGGGISGAGRAGRFARFGPAALGIGIGLLSAPAQKKLFEQVLGADYRGTTDDYHPGESAIQSDVDRLVARMLRAGYSKGAIRRELEVPRSGGPVGRHIGYAQEEVDRALNAGTRTGEDVALRGASARTPTPAHVKSVVASGSHGAGGKAHHRKGEDFELELAQAGLTPDTADDLTILQRQEALLERQLARRDLSRPARLRFTQDLASARDQVKSIRDQQKSASDERKSIRDELHQKRVEKAKAQEEKRRNRRENQISRLTEVPIDDQLAEARAEGHEKKLLAIYKRQLHHLNEQIATIKKQHLGKKALLAAIQTRNSIEAKIKGDKSSSGGAGSERSFFDEAASEFATYGSNIGRRGDVLSGQDSRAQLAEIALLLRENNRHSQSTAASTHKISRSGDPSVTARVLAHQGL